MCCSMTASTSPRCGWVLLALAAACAAAEMGNKTVRTPSVAQQRTRDVAVVRERMIERYTAGAHRSVGSAKRWMASLRPDGSWPEIDYEHKGRASWAPAAHLSRARTMAAVYRRPGHALSGDGELREAILRALGLWLKRDFQNPNWWWNQIGVPMALGPAMLLMGDEAPKTAVAIKILNRAKLGRGTGQNLVWLTEMALVRATLEDRPEVVAKAFERIAKEARVTTAEGIQPDFSFHQHGAQLYSGGYGLGFSVDCPRLAALARGTSFAFPPDTIDTLSSYLLDGQQWMVRGRTFDHAAVGREFTRHSRGGRALALRTACRDMIEFAPRRKAELEALAARLHSGKPTPGNHLRGHRHFWRSDFTAHHRLGHYTSVKMSSTRTRGWEIVNAEGLRSHYTADGMNLLYLTGEEYDGLFPAWDWQRIPGATIQQLKQPFRGRNSRGQTAFVGGVSDDTYGLSAMDFAKGKLSARKAWFFFDDEYVCMGSGITCSTDNPVLTSVSQRCLRGEVAASEPGGQGPGLWWVHHDGVGYVFDDDARPTVTVKAGPQTGRWKDINRRYSSDPVTRDVFSLWIDHGVRPANASYLYTVVPGIDAAAMPKYRVPVDVIANTRALQALHHKPLGLTAAAFYEPGQMTASGVAIGVDQRCLLLVRRGEGRLQLAVSNPENEALTVQVTLSQKLKGEECVWDEKTGQSRVTIKLPGGMSAGQSMRRGLTTVKAAP